MDIGERKKYAIVLDHSPTICDYTDGRRDVATIPELVLASGLLDSEAAAKVYEANPGTSLDVIATLQGAHSDRECARINSSLDTQDERNPPLPVKVVYALFSGIQLAAGSHGINTLKEGDTLGMGIDLFFFSMSSALLLILKRMSHKGSRLGKPINNSGTPTQNIKEKAEFFDQLLYREIILQIQRCLTDILPAMEADIYHMSTEEYRQKYGGIMIAERCLHEALKDQEFSS